MGVKKPIVQEQERMRPELSEVMKLVSDNRLAREAMGWAPRVALQEGLRRTIDFVAANQHLFVASRYTR